MSLVSLQELGKVLPSRRTRISTPGVFFLSPGFIDLHIHGGRGFDFLDATPEGFADAASFHLTGGTTSLCPTAATATYERFESVISRWQQAQSLTRCRLFPLHLEGPHLARGKAGAQIQLDETAH